MALDARLVRWCEQHLGSAPRERFFGADHLSQVHGVRLEDGREVVLKVRGRAERLRGCHAVHRAVWEAGIPCPEPLVGPEPLEDEPDRWVTAEAWVGAGELRVTDDVAEVYARLLAAIVAAAPGVDGVPPLDPLVPWLRYDHDDTGRTWPPAASDRWDPHRIEAQLLPFVLETARRARARLLAAARLPPVVGHGDLSGLNARWRLRDGVWEPVVHDWDSVVAVAEAVLAGSTAVDCVSSDVTRMATLEQTERFLDVYAAERGLTWTAEELELAWAAGAWLSAYNAAFEHLKESDRPVTTRLALEWAARLRRAGA
jgi:hypothetical protein